MKRMFMIGWLLALSLTTKAKPIAFDPADFKITNQLGGFTASLAVRTNSPGLYVAKISLHSEHAAPPPKFSVQWSVPSTDIHGFWTPNGRVDKVNYYDLDVTSRAPQRAPVIALYSLADTNRLTFACAEALRKVNLGAEIKEEDARFYCSVEFFSEHEPDCTNYETELRIDTREISYAQSLGDVAAWWAEEKFPPGSVPDSARRPMYSTWYAFHQRLDADTLVAECARAKALGFYSIIVDDGWQTLDAQRGYAFTGDWQPQRLRDMKGFVGRVHDLGLKVMLWYSLPFMGWQAANHSRFEGKFLRRWESQKTDVLDPRYPEVRNYLIETYAAAVRDWKLDGLKLDFIDFFAAQTNTVLTAEDGRDIASVNEAVNRLLHDLLARLRELNPEIMIEFRPAYTGPVMRQYANMFRADDCPNMAAVNRNRTLDLRLLSGSTAVHSDMYMWHPGEPVENAAQQLLNVIFAVPQLSVRLDTLPPKQLAMVKFWTAYWNANRDVLLAGELTPMRPAANYSVVIARGKSKTIVALYEASLVSLDNISGCETDVINATSSELVVLQLAEAAGKVRVEICTTTGELKSATTMELGAGTHSFTVPRSGLLMIHR